MSKKLPPIKATGKAKDFLAELQAFADGQRQLIEAECTGFDPDPAASEIRRTRAAQDYGFFCRTYFPHYIKGDSSVFHQWFHDTVPPLIRDAVGHLIEFSAPRGEAKSTLSTQLMSIYCVVFELKHFMPIVMDAFDQAATMLEAIKAELEVNSRLKMDFPDQTGRGRVWNASVILTANEIKIQAFGSGKRMRGLRHGAYRPDLVFLDDIENDENVRSKEQRDKLENWVLKTVLNLGPPDGSMDVVYCNTILHYDSVANRFHRKPRWLRKKFRAIIKWPDRMDLWDEWEQLFLNGSMVDEDSKEEDRVETDNLAQLFYERNKVEMERGAIVSWPTTRPLLRLMQIRSESHHAFDCEYQNDPTSDDAALFRSLQYWVQPSRDWIFLGAHDPSLGRNNKGRDPSAMLVGGLDRNHGILDIVEAKVARIQPHKQITNIINAQREFQCLEWAFETVQFQEFMRTELVKQSAKEGVPVPAMPFNRSEDKDLCIEGLSPHVFNGLIRSHRRFFVFNDQVINWPEADHDDGPDAAYMLWTIAVRRMGRGLQIRSGKRGAYRRKRISKS